MMLASCGSQEVPSQPSTEAADTALGSTATGDITGTYEVKNADGTVIMETINADGTYVDAMADGTETESGTWRIGDGGTLCFDPEGDAPETCFTGGEPGKDGSFEARDADGNIQSTVRKVEDKTETPTESSAE
ncbi:hypothetical protein [Qipengyuania qiaonensis]|nr:hypothetical protein [Qipengyuania qiaonensis]